jgi:outer membrane autotransporter protein
LGFASTDQEAPAPAVAAVLNYAPTAKEPKPVSFDQRWSVWGSTFGGAINASGDPVVGSANVSARTYGLAGGVDYRIIPDWVVGFALAGGSTNWSLAQNLGSGRSDAVLFGMYSTAHFGAAYLASSLSVANHWMKTDRFALASDHLQGSFNAQSYGARVEAGFRYAMPVAAITPYGAVALQYFSTPSYSENDLTGGGFGLTYNAASATDVRSEIGARFDSVIEVQNGMPLILRARAAWAHDQVSDPALLATFSAAQLPGAGVGFGINGAPLPTNSVLGTVGAELRLTTNLSLLAKLDGNFAGGWQSYSGNGTLRYSW